MADEQQYYFIRGNGSDEELKKYCQCFSENGSGKTLTLLKWFHQKNLPDLQSIYYAIDKNTHEIAAIYTYLPMILKLMDRKVTAMQSFDTLTDYRHRSKGLFIKLATKLEQEERTKNIELVFGFPNENSMHGFIKKLKFFYFGEVPFLVKPIRLSYAIRKLFWPKTPPEAEETICEILAPEKISLKNNSFIQSISNFEEDYEKLWQKVSRQINIAVNRDSAYMNWRYIIKPLQNYLRYGYYENGVLNGVVIFTLKNKHDGKIGYLMEIIFDPENKNAGNQLLKYSSQILKRNKADLILSWCLPHSFNYSCYKEAGYYNFPEKIRPQKLGMITKTLNSNYEKEIYNIKNWYFSYSDSDTV